MLNGYNIAINEVSPKNTTVNSLVFHITIIPVLPGIKLSMKTVGLLPIQKYRNPPCEVVSGGGGEEQTGETQSRGIEWLKVIKQPRR